MEVWQVTMISFAAMALMVAVLHMLGRRKYVEVRNGLILKLGPVEKHFGLIWDPPVQSSLGMPNTIGCMRGVVDEVALVTTHNVIASKRGTRYYTGYSASFTRPVPEGMEITSESIWSMGLGDVVKKAAGARDFKSGDPVFDEKVFVKAANEMMMHRVLASPGARQRIMELVTKHGCAIHWANGCVFYEIGLHGDSDLVKSRIEVIVSALSAIQMACQGQEVPLSFPATVVLADLTASAAGQNGNGHEVSRTGA